MESIRFRAYKERGVIGSIEGPPQLRLDDAARLLACLL